MYESTKVFVVVTPLAEQVGSLRRTLYRALSKRLAPRTDRTFQQLIALRSIALGEVHTQVQLAERLLVDAPAASRLAARLEEDGFVRRLEGADRRCVSLQVTPAGMREIRILDEALEWLDGEIRKHLTRQEVETTTRVLEKLQQGLTHDAT